MKPLVAVFGPLAAALAVFVAVRPVPRTPVDTASRAHLSLELPMPRRSAEVLPGTYDLVADRSRFVLLTCQRPFASGARVRLV